MGERGFGLAPETTVFFCRGKGGVAQPHLASQGEGGKAWLGPGTWGLGFGYFAGGSVAMLVVTAPLPPNFLACGVPHRLDPMALQAAFGPRSGG